MSVPPGADSRATGLRAADLSRAGPPPAEPAGEVTFRGRGLALRSGGGLVLLVCPLCSQRNGRPGAGRGVCQWCAYEPSVFDIEPACAARAV